MSLSIFLNSSSKVSKIPNDYLKSRGFLIIPYSGIYGTSYLETGQSFLRSPGDVGLSTSILSGCDGGSADWRTCTNLSPMGCSLKFSSTLCYNYLKEYYLLSCTVIPFSSTYFTATSNLSCPSCLLASKWYSGFLNSNTSLISGLPSTPKCFEVE